MPILGEGVRMSDLLGFERWSMLKLWTMRLLSGTLIAVMLVAVQTISPSRDEKNSPQTTAGRVELPVRPNRGPRKGFVADDLAQAVWDEVPLLRQYVAQIQGAQLRLVCRLP
jgi:hypothetical protein